MLFFTKAKRAQNVNDYESWISGGVAPTLNAMDNNGEAFATVLIAYSFDSLSSNSMKSKNPHSGCNEVTICKTIDTAALNPSANQGGIAIVTEKHLIIDGTRVDDVRVYEDGIVPTVISRYGTGGGNVPMVFPIDDARELEKHQNGTGIGAEGAPAYTLDRQQAPAVVYEPKSAFEENWAESEVKNALRANASKSSHAVATESVVRRLTPVECERLQGFPDGWTDGQADSNRYKQMGNAVAVPVVEWIISRMVGANETN
jgi:DNA (cytosine-5)-methyltransferase 1